MPEKLKDTLISKESVTQMAAAIRAVHPRFKTRRFVSLVVDDQWGQRELKEIMHHLARCLGECLPSDYGEAIQVLERAAPQISGFQAMALPDFVEIFGLDAWEISLPALGFFTRFASAEFAIRPFLDLDPDRAMGWMARWAEDEDPAVRRLASEGCRPRLPWAMALPRFKKDPSPILPVLEKLKDDESDSVRRSVANNLNDIARDNPEVTLETCEGWFGSSEPVDRLVKHACRGLLKTGNTRAMRLFGFGDPAHLSVKGPRVEPKRVAIGDELRFSFDLLVGGEERTKVRLEYAVHYVKKTGKLSRKVFQLSEREWKPGRHPIKRRHSFAERSTRKHHPGTHVLELIANGVEKGRIEIEVVGR